MNAMHDHAVDEDALKDPPERNGSRLAIATADDVKRLYGMVIELEGYRRCREEVSGALNVEILLQGELYDPSVKIDVRRALLAEIEAGIGNLERRLAAYGIFA
ncbi:MAG TPA: hypothetical protein VNK52_10895 [Hyphomicrobiaceae bacterium]|nr:hypothetical protein [Hyphomicrobiaceae bacterium]